MGFPDGSDSKESACNEGDLVLIPGLRRSPEGGHDNPLQYSCPNPYGQRSLVGYTPWGRKESDTTERLSLTLSEIVKQGTNSAGKEPACNAGDPGLIPELERYPGEGKGYLLQYSGLEYSMDYIVHGVAKGWT